MPPRLLDRRLPLIRQLREAPVLAHAGVQQELVQGTQLNGQHPLKMNHDPLVSFHSDLVVDLKRPQCTPRLARPLSVLSRIAAAARITCLDWLAPMNPERAEGRKWRKWTANFRKWNMRLGKCLASSITHPSDDGQKSGKRLNNRGFWPPTSAESPD
jgi:hypothetical protein